MTKTRSPDRKISPDRPFRAVEARLTGGLSPMAAVLAAYDWALHLANAPRRQAEILQSGADDAIALSAWLAKSGGGKPAPAPFSPESDDRRFSGEGWDRLPFAAYVQGHLMAERFWQSLTDDIPGVAHHNLDMVRFGARAALDMMSPSNRLSGNPKVLARTLASGGLNLVQGAQNLAEDLWREARGLPPAGTLAFRVGETVAATEGTVVFRNDLIELIQYKPKTGKVRPEPVLIVPAWIMKYYILDLSARNSLVRWLVDEGYTVFIISWHNPGADRAALGMSDYAEMGIYAALKAVQAIVPDRKIHATGYCIGGTLLSLAAARLAREGNQCLASLSLFAAQTDFSDAGELLLFIDEGQLRLLEDLMADTGFLDSRQMAGAFHLLRARDMVWAKLINDYLLGERKPLIDLMAWNADATRLPAEMHSEYLRRFFLDNDFAQGRYRLGGQLVTPADIALPVFLVGTENDHVAPWRSVFKLALFSRAEVTFVLTSGGHNAGVVNPPIDSHHHFRVGTKPADAPYTAPDDWHAAHHAQHGSWWPAWGEWLAARSGAPAAPPATGNAAAGFPALEPAPGSYVRER